MKSLNEIVDLFDGKKAGDANQFIARCPCHNDKKASLSISIGNNGNILLFCQAGCSTADILKSKGLIWADICEKPVQQSRSKPQFDYKNIVAFYIYRNGNRKIRDCNKNFTWQHQETDGRWESGKNGNQAVLYLQGDGSAQFAYLVEGEKDVNNLSKIGFTCYCSEHGAGTTGNKWHKEYSDELTGKDIRIIPDNDDVGIAFAEMERKNLVSVAKSIKIFDLKSVYPSLQDKGDISDVIQEIGEDETRKILEQLEKETPDTIPTADSVEMISAALKNDEKGKPVKEIGNFKYIMQNDSFFSDIRLNEIKGAATRIIDGKCAEWSDVNDAEVRDYIENNYGLYDKPKCDDAFKIFINGRKYNPILETIKAFQWDGVTRVENFLIKWAGADDTAYNRECSRLMFAGGINRALRKGCKFDDVIVLIGAQGGGKSTLVRWFAIDDEFYTSTNTIDKQKGAESVQGKWIVELEELLAIIANEKNGTGAEENAKRFLTVCSDYYRLPYEKYPTDNKRTCIFIGTTNKEEFLTDKTGNRRWFPVRCRNISLSNLKENESECHEYIRQCWAEIYSAFINHSDLANPYEKSELLSIIRAEQSDAECEDYREGMIENYIKGKAKVCIIEIWRKALLFDNNHREPTKKERNDIGEILIHHLGWERSGTMNFPEYGKQKAFAPPKSVTAELKNLPFDT